MKANVTRERTEIFGRLAEMGDRLLCLKNHIVASPGDEPNFLGLVLSGQVIGYDYTESGAEQNFFIHDKGSTFLETQVFLGQRVPVYFRATRPSELALVGREAVFAAVEADPRFAFFFIEALAEKFLWAARQVHDMNTRPAMSRLCALLLEFAEKYGRPQGAGILITEKFSQQMIGNLLHINRITVIRALAELKAAGAVEQVNGLYRINDTAALKKIRDEA